MRFNLIQKNPVRKTPNLGQYVLIGRRENRRGGGGGCLKNKNIKMWGGEVLKQS